MAKLPDSKRVTFSPGEFADLFGKSQTWGYRQIYAGRVTAISEFGRLLIPASEVEKILATAERYDGRKASPPSSHTGFEARISVLKTAWQKFLEARRKTKAQKQPEERRSLRDSARSKTSEVGRKAAIARMIRAGGKGKA